MASKIWIGDTEPTIEGYVQTTALMVLCFNSDIESLAIPEYTEGVYGQSIVKLMNETHMHFGTLLVYGEDETAVTDIMSTAIQFGIADNYLQSTDGGLFFSSVL